MFWNFIRVCLGLESQKNDESSQPLLKYVAIKANDQYDIRTKLTSLGIIDEATSSIERGSSCRIEGENEYFITGDSDYLTQTDSRL